MKAIDGKRRSLVNGIREQLPVIACRQKAWIQGLSLMTTGQLGKKWKADGVSAFDGSLEEDEDWKFRNYLSLRLKDGLWKQSDQDRDAIVVSYWWD